MRRTSFITSAKLTEEKVVKILLSTEPTSAIARKHNLSPAAIRELRTGKSWSHVRPDIPRVRSVAQFAANRSCSDCIHRIGDKCSMGFPESKRIKFAELCSVYADRPATADWRHVAFTEDN